MKEYLDIHTKQAERIATERSNGKSDKEAQQNLSEEFTKVNRLEDFAKDVSQKASQGSVNNPKLRKALRGDYLDFIMKNKPYIATRAQSIGWTIEAILDEIIRIEKIKLNPDIKPTPPNWRAGEKLVGQKALKLKRMKEDMAAGTFGSMQSMARCDVPTIKESYKKLEALRAKDPPVPKRSNYEDLNVPISSLLTLQSFPL